MHEALACFVSQDAHANFSYFLKAAGSPLQIGRYARGHTSPGHPGYPGAGGGSAAAGWPCAGRENTAKAEELISWGLPVAKYIHCLHKVNVRR